MDQSTKVSIIIPVYNVEKYLGDCLQSAVDQTLEGIEIICVDDGSSDASMEIVGQFSKRNTRIRVCGSRWENHGQAFARNCGMEMAQGDYVFFLDADDMLISNRAMQEMYEKAEVNQLECVLFDAEWKLDSVKGKTATSPFPSFDVSTENIFSGEEFLAKTIKTKKYSTVVWRQFWSKKFLQSNHISFLERTSPHEDLLFSFQAILQCNRMGYLNSVLYRYRVRDDSSSSRNGVRFENVYAHLRCYYEELLFLMHHSIGVKAKDACAQYFNYTKRIIKHQARELLKRGVDALENDSLEPMEYALLKSLLIEEFPSISRPLYLELYQVLSSADHIIVYGTGMVGRDVVAMLARYGFCRPLLAVTDKRNLDENLKSFFKEIHEIKELVQYRNESVVLVAVGEKHREEMVDQLKQLGFCKYFCMA